MSVYLGPVVRIREGYYARSALRKTRNIAPALLSNERLFDRQYWPISLHLNPGGASWDAKINVSTGRQLQISGIPCTGEDVAADMSEAVNALASMESEPLALMGRPAVTALGRWVQFGKEIGEELHWKRYTADGMQLVAWTIPLQAAKGTVRVFVSPSPELNSPIWTTDICRDDDECSMLAARVIANSVLCSFGYDVAEGPDFDELCAQLAAFDQAASSLRSALMKSR